MESSPSESLRTSRKRGVHRRDLSPFLRCVQQLHSIHEEVTETSQEQATSDTSALDRVVGLFGLYTFWASQPSGSIPPIRCVTHIPVPKGCSNISTIASI